MRKFITDILAKANLGVEQNAYVLGYMGIGTSSASQKLEVSGGDALIRNAFIGLISSYGVNYASFSHTSRAGAAKYSFLSSNAGDTYVNSANGQPVYFRHENTDNAIITADGKLGIGTTSPSAKLHVNGTFISNALWTNASSIAFWGAHDTAYGGLTWDAGQATVYATSGNKLYLASNGSSPDVTIDTNGNVGIGTTSPQSKLEIRSSGSANAGAVITLNRVGAWGSAYSGLKLNTDDAGTDWWNVGMLATTTNTFNIGQNGGAMMSILTNGNVGIGTISPSNKLEINSGTSASALRIISSNPTSLRTFFEATAGNVEQHFLYSGNQDWVLGLDKADSNKFKLASADDAFSSAKITVTTSGNVGIGTTGPAYKLDVIGNTRSNQYIFPFVAFDPSAGARTTTDPMSIKMWQNYFNGTGLGSDYGTVLEYYSRDGHVDSQVYFDASGGSWYRTAAYAGSFGAWQKYMTSLDISGTTNYVSKFTSANSLGNSQIFDNGTNVGIGTASPATLLHVAGTQYISGDLRIGSSFGSTNQTSILKDQGAAGLGIFTWGDTAPVVIGGGHVIIQSEAGANRNLYVTGNVGIGTTSPTNKLDILGKIKIDIDGTYGSGYSTIGFGGTTNGYNRIFGSTGTADGLFICSATGRDIFFRPNGGATEVFTVGANGHLYSNNYLFAYEDSSYSRLYRPNGTIGIFLGGAGDPGNYYDNTTHNFRNSGGGTFYAVIDSSGNLGIGTTSPITRLTLGTYGGSRLPYIDGTGNTFNANGITVTSANSANTAIGGGIDLTNNTYSVGAYSPIVSFSSISSNGSFNNAYAGVWGIVSGQGVDANWISGHLALGSGGGAGITERMRITSGGNIGIGTTSPSEKLFVNSGGAFMDTTVSYGTNTKGIVLNQDDGTGYGTGLWFRQSGLTAGIGSTRVNSSDWATDLRFYTHPSSTTNQNTLYERMRINSEGNVGIGTTSPTDPLTVNGSIRVGIGSGGSGTPTQSVFQDTYGGMRSTIAVRNTADYSPGRGSGYSLQNGNGVEKAYIQIAANDATQTGYSLNIGTNGGGELAISSTGASTFSSSVTAGASVTIGTGGSYVAGSIYSDSNWGMIFRAKQASPIAAQFMWATSTDTELMRINANGNVGIGTTSPNLAGATIGLSVNSSNYSVFELNQNNARAFYIYSNVGESYIGNFAASPMIFRTNDTERFRISGAGAATFSSSVTATRLILSNGDNLTWGGGYGAGIPTIVGYNAGSGGSLFFYPNGSTSGNTLTIAPTGAATFSSSVTVANGNSLSLNNSANTGAGSIICPGGGSLALRSYGNDMIYLNENSDIRFLTSNTERMRITSAGNVGIGTTNPYSPLQVGSFTGAGGYAYGTVATFAGAWSSLRPTLMLLSTDTVATQDKGAGIGFGINSEAGSTPYTYAQIKGLKEVAGGGYSGYMAFYTTPSGSDANTERMRITSVGNVGIGTASPASKFDINGGSLGFSQYNYTPSQGIYCYNGNSEYVEFGSIRTSAGSDWTSAGFRIQEKIDSTWMGFIQFNGNGNNGGISFGTGLSSSSRQAIPTRMTIDPSGNVGIGTTSPAQKLHVIGNAIVTGFVNAGTGTDNAQIGPGYLGFYNAGSSPKYIKLSDDASTIDAIGFSKSGAVSTTWFPSGNVGIGTASPAYKLDVIGDVRASSYFVGGSSGQGFSWTNFTYGSYLDLDNSQNALRIRNSANTIMLEVNGGSNYFTGNLGIGTTSPSDKLTILGSDATTFQGGGIYNSYTYGNADRAESRFNLGKLEASTYQPMGAMGAFPTTNTDSSNGILSFYTRTSQSVTEKMRITDGGNVGIGTTSPAYKLDVRGTIFSSGAFGNRGVEDAYRIKFYDNGGIANDAGIGLDGSAGLEEMWFNSLNGFYWATGTNGEKMRITQGGNVGIGTSSPVTGLDVRTSPYSNTTARFGTVRPVYIINDDPIIGFNQYYNSGWKAGTTGYSGNVGVSSAGEMYFNVSTSSVVTDNLVTQREVMRILNNGNVGIGTASPYSKLEITSSSVAWGEGIVINPANGYAAVFYRLEGAQGSNYTGTWAVGKAYSGDGGGELLQVVKNGLTGSTAYRVDASQQWKTNGDSIFGFNVGIGTASPSYKLHVEGNVSGISIYASHDIAAFSDITVKKEVKRIENAIDKVKELNGYTYVRTDDETGTRRAGVIAQEVQKVLPEVVSANPDGTLNVAYSNMVALLIEAVKEQQKEIDELKKLLKK
jgi:hypothetical protein